MTPAIFLDRDGVINKLLSEGKRSRSPRTPEEFEYTPGVADFVKQSKQLGYTVAVITNQPEVKRGFVSREMVDAFHERIQKELGIAHIFICWHDEHDNCDCRKPKPGLLLQASMELSIDLKRSFMIGDRVKDVEAAAAAGAQGILLGDAKREDVTNFQTFTEIIRFIKNQTDR
jgi:D-glycero-D-manno-heptose 1,7-bisphosphate phosphatase